MSFDSFIIPYKLANHRIYILFLSNANQLLTSMFRIKIEYFYSCSLKARINVLVVQCASDCEFYATGYDFVMLIFISRSHTSATLLPILYFAQRVTYNCLLNFLWFACVHCDSYILKTSCLYFHSYSKLRLLRKPAKNYNEMLLKIYDPRNVCIKV